MGVREQFASVAAYSLVAVASVTVVSGSAMRDAVQAILQAPQGRVTGTTGPTAVASTRVTASAPDTRAAPGTPRPAAADVLPAALPDIPGANGAAVSTVPAVPARFAAPAPAPVSETGSAALDATLRLARSITQQWYDSTLEPVWSSFSPSVKAQWKSYQDFRDFRAGGRRAYGAETAVLAEELTPHGDVTYYTRTAAFERGPRDGWTLIIGLDASGQVRDFGVVGASQLAARMSRALQ